VYWQYPANNWGAQPGYAIPSGATRATFKAKGQDGGERVKFQVGGIGNGSTRHRDTLHASAEVTLTSSWKSYSVSFAGQSYQEVLGGFGWTMTAGGSHGGGFSVDDIRWR